MPNSPEKTIFHSLFEIGAVLKGLHGLLEMSAALGIYAVSGTTISNLVSGALMGELREDPNDFLAHFVLQHASHITRHGKDFAALYLFVSGVVNIILVTGLLLHRKRFFPFAIGILLAFIVYQLVLFTRNFSLLLVALCLYDTVMIMLIRSEYRRRWPSVSPATAA